MGARSSPAAVLAAFALLAGCGEASVHTVDAVVAEAGFCGTHDNPGILKLEGLAPPMGATVNNRDIVHGFTVIDAPAEFRNFELKFAPTHTAGLPSPENPRFTLTTLETGRIIYQLTIASWARSPAHVELVASAGYETAAGCTWRFPSPLFSYEIVGGPDSGVLPEPPAKQDGALPVDTGLDVALPPVDAALDVVLPPSDTSLDGLGPPVDAAMDGGTPDVPEDFDVALEAAVGLDAGTAVDSHTDS
jgi:hypothetical protein